MEHLLESEVGEGAGAPVEKQFRRTNSHAKCNSSLLEPLSSNASHDLDHQLIPLLIDCLHDAGDEVRTAKSGFQKEGKDYGPSTSQLLTDEFKRPAVNFLDASEHSITLVQDSRLDSVDKVSLNDPGDLENIQVAIDDSSRYNNIPYLDVFDAKHESGFPPRRARQSWGDEDEMETNAPDDNMAYASTQCPTQFMEPVSINAGGLSRAMPITRYPSWSMTPDQWTAQDLPGRVRSNSDASSQRSCVSSSSLKRRSSEPLPAEAPGSGLNRFTDQSKRPKQKQVGDPQDGATEAKAAIANKKKAPLVGEHRLKINFISLGGPGETPQYFGKKRCRIPDGLSGTHELYNQKWKFESHHRRSGDVTTINWRITNLTSGTIIERTETTHEAFIREYKGQTICNQILRDALDVRAKELEKAIRDRPAKGTNGLQNSLKALRPRKCIMGLLFFGLLHQCVQENLKAECLTVHNEA